MRNALSAHRFGTVACLAALLVAGCSGSDDGPKKDPKTQATISGTVTVDGQPIPVDSVVHFESDDTGTRATGKIDALGNFSATPPDPKVGLVAGRYRVIVLPPSKATVQMTDPNYTKMMQTGNALKGGAAPTDSSPIPKDFRALQTTKLILEVKPGANTFNIDLAKIK